MKLGACALLSKLGQPFTQKNQALTQRLQGAYLTQIFEIRKEELLQNPGENCCQPRKVNEALFLENVHQLAFSVYCDLKGDIKRSLSFCRGSRVEGSMSRARVPCRGSRVTFFSNYFFSEKVIIDAINVIKTNKKNLKNKWRVNIFQLLGGVKQRKAPGQNTLLENTDLKKML